MNTISASEIKRCGISAVDELLDKGPVHVIKNNRRRYVVLTEEAYQELTAARVGTPPLWTVLEMMLDKPAPGRHTREEVDAWLQAERDSWEQE